MDCVCGCEREIPASLQTQNFWAACVALELLAWDKERAVSGLGSARREDLIARGADCYQRQLRLIHGEGSGGPDPGAEDWLEESATERKGGRPAIRRLLGARGPDLSDDDKARLDRLQPERSFTGRGGSAETSRSPTPGGRGSEDLIDGLERLRALHTEGALTEAEFATAKSRLLDRD